jgi:hypothetical protein
VRCGLTAGAFRPLLLGTSQPTRPTVGKIATGFGLPDSERAELYAMRTKHPSDVARGRRLLEKVGIEVFREWAARGRAAVGPRTPEQAQLYGWISAARTRRLTTPEAMRERIAALHEDRRRWIAENGSRFRSPETRALFLERLRASGAGERAQQTIRDRYGQAYFDRLHAYWRAADTWRRIKRSNDEAMKARVWTEMRAYIAYLQNPKRRGRPAAFEQNREIAVAAAVAYECGCTTTEIADMLGWARGKDGRRNVMGGTWTREMINRGQTILGLDAPNDAAQAS